MDVRKKAGTPLGPADSQEISRPCTMRDRPSGDSASSSLKEHIMAGKEMTRKAFHAPSYYLHTVICLLIMFGFGQLPAVEPLTPLGMNLIGIFFGVLYGWIAIEIVWPSLAGLLALGSCPQQFFPSLNVVVDYWRTGDQDVFEGPIPAMIAGVTMLLAKKARVGAARRRYLVPALRECFVNILQHRSYEEADREMPVLISPVAREFQIEYDGSTLRLDHGGRAQAKDLCRRP